MKIIKTASGKKSVKLSKREWLNIGKKAGWIKKKAQINNNIDDEGDKGDEGWLTQEKLDEMMRPRKKTIIMDLSNNNLLPIKKWVLQYVNDPITDEGFVNEMQKLVNRWDNLENTPDRTSQVVKIMRTLENLAHMADSRGEHEGTNTKKRSIQDFVN